VRLRDTVNKNRPVLGGALVVGLVLGWAIVEAMHAASLGGWLGETARFVIATALGAVIGALGAYIIARENRAEASWTRFHANERDHRPPAR
jgi:hypothetical protein